MQNNLNNKSLVHRTLSAKVIDIDNYTGTFEAIFTIDCIQQAYTCKLYSRTGEKTSPSSLHYLNSIIMNKKVIFECLDFDEDGILQVKIAA